MYMQNCGDGNEIYQKQTLVQALLISPGIQLNSITLCKQYPDEAGFQRLLLILWQTNQYVDDEGCCTLFTFWPTVESGYFEIAFLT